MNPLISVLPKDILNLIFIPLVQEGYGATISCVDKQLQGFIFSIMLKNASKIGENLENKTSIFYQFIQKRLDLKNLNSYSKCSSLFQDLVQKAHSLGGNCPKRILFPEEIPLISDQIEQVQNLERIWPILLKTITWANSGQDLNAPEQNAAAIRSWLAKNSTLLQKVRRLDLNHQDLSLLPTEIGLFTSLNELFVSSNKLISLPPEIGRLTNLKVLDVSDNAFTTIPPEIGQLENLEYLLISRNKLSTLPPEIGKLSKLTMLSVSCSGLTEIPPEVWKLTNLRSLYVSKNTVITIPPEVGRLIHLEILHVSSIPIDKFETSQPLKSCVIT